MPGSSFDFIVVGGGHNGIVAASILRAAGASVLLVTGPRLGGLAGPSHKGLLGPAYSVGLMPSQIARLLSIDPAGWLVTPEPSWVVVEGGEVVFRWWSSRERLLGEFKAHGAGDEGERVISIIDSWRRCAPRILYSLDPPSIDDAAAAAEECGGPELGDAVARPAHKGLLAGLGWLSGLLAYPALLEEPGYSVLYFNLSRGVWGQIRGGEPPAEALASAARRLGVSEARGPARIIVRGGRAAAVRLPGGRVVEARRGVVFAGHIACLAEYVEGEGPWREELESVSRRALSASSRAGGPARFNAILSAPPRPPAEGSGGAPIVEVWGPGYWGEAVYPTLHGAPGPHYVAFTGYPGSPGTLRALLEDLGVDPDSVEAVEDLGPLAQEAEHCNPGGHPNHLPMTRGYILDRRPAEGWAGYKTSVEGLYHASASSHPGGQITGIPGFNAARRILLDIGVKPWPALEAAVREPFRSVAEEAVV
jgi:phytoene dehydrogenase-like protein